MFAVTSRYYSLEVLARIQPDGSVIRYAARRIIPDPGTLTDLSSYVVGPADRLDRIAATQLGDPQQAWRIADAARVLDEDELTATPGRILRITLPAELNGGLGG